MTLWGFDTREETSLCRIALKSRHVDRASLRIVEKYALIEQEWMRFML